MGSSAAARLDGAEGRQHPGAMAPHLQSCPRASGGARRDCGIMRMCSEGGQGLPYSCPLHWSPSHTSAPVQPRDTTCLSPQTQSILHPQFMDLREGENTLAGHVGVIYLPAETHRHQDPQKRRLPAGPCLPRQQGESRGSALVPQEQFGTEQRAGRALHGMGNVTGKI